VAGPPGACCSAWVTVPCCLTPGTTGTTAADSGHSREPCGRWRCIDECVLVEQRRTIDDAEAVARSRDGDLDAYAVLVARYTLRAHRAAFLLGAGEEADDVVQEAFVKAFRHLSRFRAGEPFGPWLLRIVSNETRNLTRSQRRRAALALRLSAAGPPGTAGDGPVDELLAAERRAGLLAAVSTLPDKERQVVVCRYFLDLSEAGTAQVLGWPLGSVKSRTSRALNRLRGLLAAGQQDRISSG
jgi:RNA polymerase sigma-70 factor (ECF subfamily)